jgi:predicted heme/steroid binding protein/uncharacterized membrane protein
MREFDPAEIAQYNGQDGKPIYVAHEGRVYDVSASKLWKGGLHMRRHRAGSDLTVDIQAAPHGKEVLERYPLVGMLRKAEVELDRKLPAPVAWLLETNPFFRRHPHPMTVHFPIVFLLATPVFNTLSLLTGNPAFETTAFHCLVGGTLFSLVAILTGFFTWWYNYMAKMVTPVALKIPLSISVLVLSVILVVWRLKNPSVMMDLQGVNLLYFALSVALFPLVSIIGWFGATMTFPIEKE